MSSTFQVSYHGGLSSKEDVMLLITACRENNIPLVARNLLSWEKDVVKSGSVFIFREGSFQGGANRWHDGFRWERSRIKGIFLVYYQRQDDSSDEEAIRPRRRQSDRFVKRAVTVRLKNGECYHLISYYYDRDFQRLRFPTKDSYFNGLQVDINIFPELTRTALYTRARQNEPQESARISEVSEPSPAQYHPPVLPNTIIPASSATFVNNPLPTTLSLDTTRPTDYIAFLEQSVASCLAGLSHPASASGTTIPSLNLPLTERGTTVKPIEWPAAGPKKVKYGLDFILN